MKRIFLHSITNVGCFFIGRFVSPVGRFLTKVRWSGDWLWEFFSLWKGLSLFSADHFPALQSYEKNLKLAFLDFFKYLRRHVARLSHACGSLIEEGVLSIRLKWFMIQWRWTTQNPTQRRRRHRGVGFCVTPFQLYTIRNKKGKTKNYTNYTQTLHLTLHSFDFPYVTKCIVCASNYTQTIHKTLHWSVQNPTRKVKVNPTQNATWRRSKPYTKRRANPTLQRRAVYLGAHLSEIRRRLILTGCAPSFS